MPFNFAAVKARIAASADTEKEDLEQIILSLMDNAGPKRLNQEQKAIIQHLDEQFESRKADWPEPADFL